MALLLGSAQQLTSVEIVGNALNGKPYVARSGVYIGEIESAVLSTRYPSKKEEERGLQTVQCIHLGILGVLEGDESYAGQLWVDADVGVPEGMKDHLTDLCFLTGNIRQNVDQMGNQFLRACLDEKVEPLKKANARGETSITTFPGLVGKKVLVAVSRYGESKSGQPRLYLRGFFALDGRSAVEQVSGQSAQDIQKVRSRLTGSEPLWAAPKREQTSKSYSGGYAASQSQAAYGQGIQPPQTASGQAQSAYGQAAQAGYAAQPQPSYAQTIAGGQSVTHDDGVPF